MARRKSTPDGTESDLIETDRNGHHDIGQAETESGHGPGVADYSKNKEYVAAQAGTDVGVADDAADDAQSAANLVGQSDRLAIKRANFKRLCDKRVTKILTALDVLKNLANTNTYDWTQDQHNKIFDRIENVVTDVRLVFENAKKTKVRDKSQLRFDV